MKPRPAIVAYARRRFKGSFWRLEDPSCRIEAELKLGRHGKVTLRLESTEEAGSLYLLNRSHTAQGDLQDGTKVTLWARPQENLTMTGSRGSYHRWATALLDEHLGSDGETLFQSSSVSFEGVDMWTRTGPVPHDATRPEYPVGKLVDVYGTGTDVDVQIENPAVYESFPDGPDRFRRFLGEDGRISFTTTPAAPLELHRRLWFDLRSLVTYSTQQAAFMFDHRASTSEGQTVRIVEYRSSAPPARRTHAGNLLLSPAQVDPAVLFPRWWEALDALYPVPQVLVGRHYVHRAQLEGHAMAAFAAAERLHVLLQLPTERFTRPFFKENVRALREYAKQLPETPESEDFHQYLREAFQNRRSFRTRLAALASAAGEAQLAAAGIDTETWLTAVSQARNVLAHTGSHVKERSDDGAELLRLADHGTRVVLALALRTQVAPRSLTPDQARKSLLNPRLRLEPATDTDNTRASSA